MSDQPDNNPDRRRWDRRGESHETFLLQPVRRIYVTVLAAVLIAAFTAAFFGTQDYFRNIDERICTKINVVRYEMNARVPEYIQSANNLEKLLSITTHTRSREARAWIQIYRLVETGPGAKRPITLKLERDINNLIAALSNARLVDYEIYLEEKQLRFKYLPILNCKRTT